MSKKWTVILIPHDRGDRRSFDMSKIHVMAGLTLIAVLFFTTAFFVQRSITISQQASLMKQELKAMELKTESPESAPLLTAGGDDWREREAKLRAEFEQKDKVLQRELSRLYDLEKEVRIITGLPTQLQAGQDVPLPPGTGGREGAFEDGKIYLDNSALTPPQVIFDVSNPSADMMLQEINVRLRSLEHMKYNMEGQRLRIAHTPSIWPTNHSKRRINSKYGYRKHPITKRLSMHKGVDITAPYGESIISTASGKVIFSGYHQYLGHVVKIDHGYGLESWYGHMSKRMVKVGDTVIRGQLIGKVGSSGRSTGPHIHYEVHMNGKTVDPKKFIGH